MNRRLRIGLVASVRHPIREPFAGGLEAHTWHLARALVHRGHEVALFAGPGSDPELGAREMRIRSFTASRPARADTSMPAENWMAEHHAYLNLMIELSRGDRFDVIHNNSLHYLPVAMAAAVPTPLVTTLHTPPTPWLESAIDTARPCPVTFTAVSRHTAHAWKRSVRHARVVHNGVDTRLWRPGPGGPDLAWTGRLVPEKGPHLAIAAARKARRKLRLAGPISDQDYFDTHIAPNLGDGIEYVGHLSRLAVADLVASSAALLVTPCWDEPYGLVVAESLACGTPVAGFDRGALGEILTPATGRLVGHGDIDALAEAIAETAALSREAARARAEDFCSLDTMTSRYEGLYRELVP
ncbi:glycosyltransferase [Streptodolium elevatio]